MHAHAQPLDGLLNIASGVTSVRDMGNDIDELAHLQTQWQTARPSALGLKAGFIDGPALIRLLRILVSTPRRPRRGQPLCRPRLRADQLYSSLKPELSLALPKPLPPTRLRVSGPCPQR